MTGNDCGCGERREYMTLGEYMALYPSAYAEATKQMTERQKRLFELRFSERLLFLPKDEAVPDSPADPSRIDIKDVTIDGVTGVSYDPDSADVLLEYNGAKVQYIDRSTGEEKEDDIENVGVVLPIDSGKYIAIGTNDQGKNLIIGVDDTALSSDYYKIDKSSVTQITVPVNNKGTVGKLTAATTASANTLVLRDSLGNIKVYYVVAQALRSPDNASTADVTKIIDNIQRDFEVTKTSTNTGTLSVNYRNLLKSYMRMCVNYDNQIYHRMDPINAPDGTMTFVHIDTLQNGSGGYKATGKAFSVTVSTGAWQVVDLDFAGSGGDAQNAFLHHISIVTTGGNWYSFDVTTHNAAELTFSDLVTQLDGITVNGLRAESPSTAMNITPAIVRTNGADSRIEIVSTDFAVISSYSEAQIESVSDMVTEIAPVV